MRLADLLNVSELALTLHGGKGDVTFQTVRNVALPRHRAWLSEGDLRLGEVPLEPAHLFHPVPSAIGYALTPKHRTLPPEILAKASALDVALFTAPPHVNLARVEEAALRLLAQENLGSLEVGSSLQSYLLDALESPKPERDLLERLAIMSGGSFALLTPWGSLLARSGPRGWRRAAGSLESLPEGLLQRGDGGYLTFRVEQGGRLRSVLVAQEVGSAWLPLLELARSLLRLAAAQRELEVQKVGSNKSLLLNEWLSSGANAGLVERLKEAGLEGSYLVAVSSLRRIRSKQRYPILERLRGAGDEFFGTLGLPMLSTTRGEEVVWVFSGRDPDAQLGPLLKALRNATDEPFQLGVSAAITSHQEVKTALRQARLAAQSVREVRGGRSSTHLEPVTLLLQRQSEESLRALHAELVGTLRAGDSSGKLRRTLHAYLRSPDDMISLAAELHIHVNTLRYRLGRIETLIGLPLSEPQTLAKLYLAEQIEEMLAMSDEQ